MHITTEILWVWKSDWLEIVHVCVRVYVCVHACTWCACAEFSSYLQHFTIYQTGILQMQHCEHTANRPPNDYSWRADNEYPLWHMPFTPKISFGCNLLINVGLAQRSPKFWRAKTALTKGYSPKGDWRIIPDRKIPFPMRWECMPGSNWENPPQQNNKESNFLFYISKDIWGVLLIKCIKFITQLLFFIRLYILFCDIIRIILPDHPLCK